MSKHTARMSATGGEVALVEPSEGRAAGFV
jgi:hypothetical protein